MSNFSEQKAAKNGELASDKPFMRVLHKNNIATSASQYQFPVASSTSTPGFINVFSSDQLRQNQKYTGISKT